MHLEISGKRNMSAGLWGVRSIACSLSCSIIFGFWFAFMIIQAIAVDRQKDPLASGGATIFKRGAIPAVDSLDASSLGPSERPDEKTVAKSSRNLGNTFAWEDVVYEVPVEGGTRRLLNKVTGYVRPGTLTALMGESGAGESIIFALSQSSVLNLAPRENHAAERACREDKFWYGYWLQDHKRTAPRTFLPSGYRVLPAAR